ncbi:unnamed protein product [Nezara viridula]|uniref:Uncharacterized protein n=1 Tax=Nezara viridula TaxID=85310 RepID=A0A9P0HTL5_NEZVI|nr:unnamed protein product [Nezara viridula]
MLFGSRTMLTTSEKAIEEKIFILFIVTKCFKERSRYAFGSTQLIILHLVQFKYILLTQIVNLYLTFFF